MRKRIFGFFAAIALAASPTLAQSIWSFEDSAVGALPATWQTDVEEVSWEVTQDATAPSGENVLTMSTPDTGGLFNMFGRSFNIAWTDTPFLDGEIEVQFKAVSGKVDQGGGIMWRVQDGENYYVARFNPLEDNLRIYTVRNGARRQIASATITLPDGWHSMKIVQNGDEYTGFLDGVQLLSGTDSTFPQTGGVGLWTKADAVTSFDDLRVR